ncbi:MAG: DJ-1 family glyoxalase III [Planctomycetota bacterium]
MSRVLLLLAEGAEEMEVTITVDVLRRAGVNVVIAGVDSAEPVECSRGVRIVPDVALAAIQAEAFDLVVLPGGAGGTDRLCGSAQVGRLLAAQQRAGRPIAAICAAPRALVRHGIADGLPLTSHPSVRDEVAGHGEYSEDAVVRTPQLITSRGPGTSFEFALTLVERLCGAAAAQELRGPMMLA